MYFLYLGRSRTTENSAICIGDVNAKPGAGKRIELVKTAANARYVPDSRGGWPGRSGWLVFVRNTTLFAPAPGS